MNFLFKSKLIDSSSTVASSPMPSRRRFLSTLGLGLALAPFLLSQESRQRRSRWEMIANDDPVRTPAFRPDPSGWDNGTITAAWIGHSTVLINFYGMHIITDPVFSERIGLAVGGLFTIGPKRLVSPALPVEQLPPIDLILLSHAHMDHLDVPSLKKFDRKIPVIMAKNTADVIEDLDFQTVYELDWGKWTQIRDLRIEAFEVKHFGWRYPWEQDRSRGNHEGRSYNAYLLSRRGKNIVFGGDTSYHEMFKRVSETVKSVDLALMPIGAYDPWIHNHANPEQALAMATQMGAHYILPIHWSTFIQSEEPTPEPIERLKKASAATPDRIVLDSVGQTWSLSDAITQRTVSPGAVPHCAGTDGR
jgi:L-ascorbate metabolism protein UlaG (beta-lactamase superfamily)